VRSLALSFISSIVGFANSVKEQTKDVSKQSVKLLDHTTKSLNSTFVGNPDAGLNQTPPEDAHPDQVNKLKKNILLGLNRVISEELLGIGKKDYSELKSFVITLYNMIGKTIPIGEKSIVEKTINESLQQFGDVVQTNSVEMDSGNTVEVLSSSEVKVLKSLLTRAGTLIRNEAPVFVDTAHSRVLLAHTLLAEADLLINKAKDMLVSVKDEFGLSAENIGIIAGEKLSVSAKNIKIVGDRIDLNPASSSRTSPASIGFSSKAKNSVQLPQWSDMSPIPAFISSTDEFEAQEG
jgi:hypothetical protein